MAFNLSKQSFLSDLQELILQEPGAPPPDFGADQVMVEMRWENGGKSMYPDPKTMVDALGGIDAMRASINQVAENPDDARDYIDTVEQITSFAKPFNFNKQSQMPMTQQAHEPKKLYFADHGELKKYLDSMIRNKKGLMLDLRDNGIGDAEEAIEHYYKIMGLVSKGIGTKESALDFVNKNIFELLPSSLKDEGGIVTNKAANTDIQEAIKKIAEKNTKKKDVKSFNLNKTSQHKTQENVIMYGPDQVRKVDPFSRQPVSDWHIVERNKGFGLVVGDVWNIDYETIWRENIMDKYSRPYKDKDGNWVGGYIQKRFEVDKNIPASSNIQLKPGQKRRPIIPEYGNTESRLQAARAAGDIAGANDTSKPFNWKEASSKKKSLKK